jgi:hypothetical protein
MFFHGVQLQRQMIPTLNNHTKWKPVKTGVCEYNSSFLRQEWAIELQQISCGWALTWVGSQSQKHNVLKTFSEEEEYPAFRLPCGKMLSGDSFESPIFSLQLSLAVALDRRPAWLRVLPLNHLSFSNTLTNHILVIRTGVCHDVVNMLS